MKAEMLGQGKGFWCLIVVCQLYNTKNIIKYKKVLNKETVVFREAGHFVNNAMRKWQP